MLFVSSVKRIKYKRIKYKPKWFKFSTGRVAKLIMSLKEVN